MPAWRVEYLPGCFRQLDELAEAHGYLPAAFGSVLGNGEGNDLDVLMVARRGVTPDRAGFLAAFGGRTVSRADDPAKGIDSIKIECTRGYLWHFIFGTVRGGERWKKSF